PARARACGRTFLPLAASLVLAGPLAGQAPDTDIWIADLERRDGALALGVASNLTAREGYDNQPSFTPDGGSLLYTSRREDQTDTYRLDLATGRIEPVTSTPESEYSPTVMPGGDRFSAVRVEADSTQRLWSFDLDGTDPRLVLSDVAPVGYHAWVDAGRVVLFVLGSPPALHLAELRTGATRVVAEAVGRSLQPIPGRAAVSFVDRSAEPWWIAELDATTGEVRRIVETLEGSEDHAWTPDGLLLMGRESGIYAFDPAGGAGWRQLAALRDAGVDAITRLAVSPDGRRLAWVATAPPADETP
ncbi:MAG: TolB family protein, partial [Gemmatimonadota bacterium]